VTPILQITHSQQSTEGYCLPACARMRLAYVGVEKTEAEAIRLLNAQEYGTPSFAIQRLSSLGLNVRYQEWSIAELMSALVNSQPLVVFVRTGFLDY
jgi:chemotaxis regulatin CheY-phosphate phosphatase CheZ